MRNLVPSALFVNADGKEKEDERKRSKVNNRGKVENSKAEVAESTDDGYPVKCDSDPVYIYKGREKSDSYEGEDHCHSDNCGGELILCERGDEGSYCDKCGTDENKTDYATDDLGGYGAYISSIIGQISSFGRSDGIKRDKVYAGNAKATQKQRKRRQKLAHYHAGQGDGRGEQQLLGLHFSFLCEQAHCEKGDQDDEGKDHQRKIR